MSSCPFAVLHEQILNQAIAADETLQLCSSSSHEVEVPAEPVLALLYDASTKFYSDEILARNVPPGLDKNREKELREQLTVITKYDADSMCRYIPSRPGLPTPPFPPQYLPPNSTTYPWSSPTIPWESGMAPPGTPNGDGYAKFRSVPLALGFYMNVDMLNVSPSDPLLSVFLTNFEDRGDDNYRKRVYMSALTMAQLPLYKEKTDSFINEFFAAITTYERPVLSAFRESLIRYFLSIHVGVDDYPQEIVDYFNIFVDVVGFGDPNRPGRDDAMIFGNVTTPAVRSYFASRVTRIIETDDKSTMIYHWHRGGLDNDGIVMEAIHNIIAFSQFNNLVYLAIRDKISGTPVPSPPLPVPAISYDFFGKMLTAPTENEKLNVVREAYRLLTPNNTFFSLIRQTVPDIPSTSPQLNSRQLPKLMMIQADQMIAKNYFLYDTSRYVDYSTNFSESTPLPASSLIDVENPATNFVKSPVDNETVLTNTNLKMVPVYPRPNYCPFGLGYRRCPGEIFACFVTQKVISRLAPLAGRFAFRTGDYPLITLAPFSAVPDNVFVTPLNP